MKVYERGPMWWADFNYDDASGRRKRWRKSLRLDIATSSRRAALARAEGIRRDLESSGVLDATLSALGIEAVVAPVSCPFSGLAHSYIEQRGPDMSISTVPVYKRSIRIHLIPVFGDGEASEIAHGDVLAMRLAMIKKGLAPRTINGHITVLRNILGHGVMLGHLQRNVVSGVKRLTVPESEVDWYTWEEGEELLRGARLVAPGYAGALRLALRTGLRVGEICALKRANVDMRRRIVMVRETRLFIQGMGAVDKPPKSRSSHRDVPMSDDLHEAMELHLQTEKRLPPCPYMFSCCSKTGPGFVPISKNGMTSAIKRSAEAVGMRVLGPHGLRHSFGSQLANLNVQLIVIRDLMGHASVESTQIYAHLTEDSLSSAVASLSARPAGPGTPTVHGEGTPMPKP